MSKHHDTILKVAKLAKLHPLENQEKQANDFDRLLQLFDTLSLDDANISASCHAIESMVQPTREDVVTETDQHQAFQSIAPKVSADVYLVPSVITPED